MKGKSSVFPRIRCVPFICCSRVEGEGEGEGEDEGEEDMKHNSSEVVCKLLNR